MKLRPGLLRYRKRLESLGFWRSIYYIAKVIYGETFRRRGPNTFGLRMVEIGVTKECQCNCPHCYAIEDGYTSEINELSKREIFSIVDQIVDMGAIEICFSGGEPLIRKDIVDLVEYARKMKMVPKINTNGILLTENMVRKLKQAGLAWCMVSIDHSHPSIHDSFRGYENCFTRAINGLKELVKQGIPSGITTVARKELIRSGVLAEIVSLGHELKVNSVRILFPVLTGRFKNAFDEVLSPEERDSVRKLLKDPLVSMEYKNKHTICTAGITKYNILPNGDVTPCVFVPIVFGNTRHDNMKEIWKRMNGFAHLDKPQGQCPLSDPSYMERAMKSNLENIIIGDHEKGDL